ncbi:pepsin/retropepsin-like aspartic protease family protein [Novosphingobium sp. ZN18A2]|uniref:pepsin/retropepsin-like aspartic protease family protein n=1 Tax=Novosphingobium sp. ZN18A2 TaxID=3079861 RepID=UPI0030D4184C
MTMTRWPGLIVISLLAGCSTGGGAGQAEAHLPLHVAQMATGDALARPFTYDAHSHEVAVQATIDGIARTFLIDTGVDPSAVDLAVARDHSLKQVGGHGEVEGVGKSTATAYPSIIPEISIGGERYGPLDVLVIDMSKLSAGYGAPLGGILGYSLFKDHAILIDYPTGQMTIFNGSAAREPSHCAKSYRFPLRFLSDDDHLITVPGLKIGGTEIPAFIDTGSSNGLRIAIDAPATADIRAALPEGRESTSVGARGTAAQRLAKLSTPVQLGPFTLDDADVAIVHGGSMPIGIGNRFFEALGATLLVDIPAEKVGLFEGCR